MISGRSLLLYDQNIITSGVKDWYPEPRRECGVSTLSDHLIWYHSGRDSYRDYVISHVVPIVEMTIVAPPTGLRDLIPYSDSPNDMISPEYISPLPATSAFICIDSSKTSRLGILLMDH
ncbi:hypothetical protein Tco_1555652 [Tanacetum coccineum]